MARGEIYNAQVESIAAGGAGIARIEGKTVFIELTAPGDQVMCRISKEKKTWAEAELLGVLEPSPLRREIKCHYFGICGGCTLQHLDYAAQIEAKTAILRGAFEHIGNFIPPKITVRESAPYEYRNKQRFHIIRSASGQEEARLGFKERNSSLIVDIDDCPVADPGIRKALKNREFSMPGKKERLNVYSRGGTFLCDGGQQKGKVSILDRELAMDVKLFFQSNAAMLELLITDLLALAEKADKNLPLADIYSGVGTFASFLCRSSDGSPSFPEIDLVEENKAALALARENIDEGSTGNHPLVNYHAMTDTAWVVALEGGNKKNWGLMVLDPPRDGLSVPLRHWLAGHGPELVAYVSCDPATLARDSRVLVEGAYKLMELYFYDFYPQTAHIESLAVFSRKAKQ